MKLTLVIPNKFHAERLERVMDALSKEQCDDLMYILENAENQLKAKSRHICAMSEAKRKEYLISQVLKQKLGDVLFEQDCQEPYYPCLEQARVRFPGRVQLNNVVQL